ncbi:MAG: transporter substrate-binding domain-containing protein [Desulfomonile tiedjei]|nr:transporter substrate-binding domain-containing protein [Desulfomonile tiedjei]
MARARALLTAMAVTSLLMSADLGQCGPVFERVMKSGTIRLGLPYNRVPQGFLKPTGEWVGFEVDLGTEMAKHMNLKLEAVKVNDKTWPTLLAEGRIDAALCRIRHTRSVEGEYDLSVAYFFDSLYALIPKGGLKTISDFKGHKVAAVQGSSAEKTAMRLLKESGDDSAEKNVISYPDRPSCFMALGREKVSAWVDTGTVLLEYASRSPGRFELMPVSQSVEEIAAAMPQDDSAWRDLINFAIQDMAADGSLKKIYDQWFGPETPYPFPSRRSIEIWSE